VCQLVEHCAMANLLPDRRRYPRLPLSIPVFVRGTDKEGRDFLEFATALNISAGGVLLATRRSLPKSAVLSLEIPVAPLPASAAFAQSIRTLKARMVRTSHGEKYNLLGMKFSRPIAASARPAKRGKGKASSSK
jgi:c-di-GMP-binding flagellar brake protein YcgR